MAFTYYITDRQSCALPLLEQITAVVEAGVEYVQIREKDLSGRDLVALVRAAVQLAKRSGTRILVNDRLDVVLATGAQGVHLARDSFQPSEVRRVVGRGPVLIGASTHSLEEVEEACAGGVDYLLFGPVFFTPSKAPYGRPAGLAKLREAVQIASVPVFALGGITEANYLSCLQQGAAGVAAIRLFQQADTDLTSLIATIKRQG
ncbi:MAG: thiamine phosphate synthase [Acidobacteriota bacterium]